MVRQFNFTLVLICCTSSRLELSDTDNSNFFIVLLHFESCYNRVAIMIAVKKYRLPVGLLSF